MNNMDTTQFNMNNNMNMMNMNNNMNMNMMNMNNNMNMNMNNMMNMNNTMNMNNNMNMYMNNNMNINKNNMNNNMNMNMNMMNNNMNMNMNMNNMMNMNNNMNNMNMNNNMNNMNMNNNMNNINNQMMMQNFFRDFYTKTMAIYQMFNKINQMNNSNNKIKIVQGGSMTNSKKLGRLPRGKETVDYDPFIGYNGPKLNLMFETPSGHKTNIVCPLNVKVYDILRQYTAKVGLGPNVIGNGIYFLYNGRRLGKSFYDSQVEQVFTHGEKVVVIDYGNLIGA